MSEYTHRRDELKLTIDEAAILKGHAVVRIAKDGRGYAILVDAAERQAAAQALAGDEWRVVSAKQPGPPAPIDPADVKVGDVAEVEAADGSWLVRGEVTVLDPASTPYRLRLRMERHGQDGLWPRLTDNTVRLVRRAEPPTCPTCGRPWEDGGMVTDGAS